MIQKTEIPIPTKTPLEIGQKYYVATVDMVSIKPLVYDLTWCGSFIDYECMRMNAVYINRRDAEKAGDEMAKTIELRKLSHET